MSCETSEPLPPCCECGGPVDPELERILLCGCVFYGCADDECRMMDGGGCYGFLCWSDR